MWGVPFCKKGLPTFLPKNFHILFAGQSPPAAKPVRQKVIEVLEEVTRGNPVAQWALTLVPPATVGPASLPSICQYYLFDRELV